QGASRTGRARTDSADSADDPGGGEASPGGSRRPGRGPADGTRASLDGARTDPAEPGNGAGGGEASSGQDHVHGEQQVLEATPDLVPSETMCGFGDERVS